MVGLAELSEQGSPGKALTILDGLRVAEPEQAPGHLARAQLVPKGGLLDTTGRRREARIAYAEAWRQLVAQPPHRRGNPAWARSRSDLRGGLNEP
ncbi:MAG: hypothetical protein ABFS46_13045 [Myxococcota bacterium]